LKKKIIRLLAAILATTMLITLLAGCRSEETGADFVFLPEFITLPDDVTNVRNLTYASGRLFFTSTITINQDTWEQITKIFSMNLDGTNITELENYVPLTHPNPDAEGSSQIGSLSADSEGNLWVAEMGYFYITNIPDDWEGEEYDLWMFQEYLEPIQMFRKLDPTGTEILSIDLSGATDDNSHVSAYSIDDDGNIYLGYYDFSGDGEPTFGVIVLDSDGNEDSTFQHKTGLTIFYVYLMEKLLF